MRQELRSYCSACPERSVQEYLNRFVLKLHRQVRRDGLDRIRDASIPMGWAGVFLLLRKIRAKHAVWMQRLALESLQDMEAYRVWFTGINGAYAMHRGLLAGISGIGLALLASVWEREAAWDESLLLS